MCLMKPKTLCDLLYCVICFIGVVWNQNCSISEVCLYKSNNNSESKTRGRKDKSPPLKQKAFMNILHLPSSPNTGPSTWCSLDKQSSMNKQRN